MSGNDNPLKAAPFSADPFIRLWKAPVADRSLGSCRGAVVDGCEQPSLDGTVAWLQVRPPWSHILG